MRLKEELTAAFIETYRVAGKEVGYWGRRFLQAVKRNGGLATAKRMLLPRNANQRKALDALLEANRPELSVEAIVLQPKFMIISERILRKSGAMFPSSDRRKCQTVTATPAELGELLNAISCFYTIGGLAISGVWVLVHLGCRPGDA